jgi:tetratricopeptide (TPR) repeat protein
MERWAYFAGMGIFLIVTGLGWSLSRGRRALRNVLVAAVLICISLQAGLSEQRIRIYGSPEALWRESLTRNPLNRRALSNLGTYYSRMERWDEAVELFERMLKYNPSDGPVYWKLAYIYMHPSYPGRNDERAYEYQKKARELDPDNFLGLFNMSILCLRMDRPAEAEDLLRRTIQLNPRFARAHGLLGEITLSQNRRAEAVTHFEEALRLDPGDKTAAKRLRELTGR